MCLVCGLVLCNARDWRDLLTHGGMRGFPTYDQANAVLDAWVRDYPELLRKLDIGHSFEMRRIYAYSLGAGGVNASDRPRSLITALMHAREPSTLAVLMYFIGTVLENYSKGEPEVVQIVDTRTTWFVPFVNPDSYVAIERKGLDTIRKNQRPTCADPSQSGVDLNRNWGAPYWSPDFGPCNEEYAGTHPFSEPETQALRAVCEGWRPSVVLHFHCCGNLLAYPFNGVSDSKLPQEDQAIYDDLSRAYKARMSGPAPKILGYLAVGESDDWVYGALGIISATLEIVSVRADEASFWTDPRVTLETVERNYPRIAYTVRKAGFLPELRWSRRSMTSIDLEVFNTGLARSRGTALHLAVGAEPVALVADAATMVALDQTGSTGEVLLQASGGVLVARLPTLARRTRRKWRLELQGELPPSWRFCALEWRGASAGAERSVCLCSDPAAPDRAVTLVAASVLPRAGQPATGGKAEARRLCTAAGAAAFPEAAATGEGGEPEGLPPWQPETAPTGGHAAAASDGGHVPAGGGGARGTLPLAASCSPLQDRLLMQALAGMVACNAVLCSAVFAWSRRSAWGRGRASDRGAWAPAPASYGFSVQV